MSKVKKTVAVPSIRIFGDDRVLINNVNGDRFVLSMQEAVDACGAFSRQKELARQWDLFCKKLAEWSYRHRESIRLSHLTVRDSRLFFVVVQKGVKFDRALCDELSDLDLELANNPELDLIRFDTIVIPNSSPESLAAFIPLESLT